VTEVAAGPEAPSPRRTGPLPVDEATRRRFVAQRRRDTAPELAIRRELHRRGLRYRVDVSPDGGRLRADVVFSRARVAVFVDGCFWHCCPIHGTAPRHNNEWWRAKFARTVARDRELDARLAAAGWTPLRIWEHVPPADAAATVEAVVRAALGRQP
jgi:DNA mismatch endonuclease (patch repair protein)